VTYKVISRSDLHADLHQEVAGIDFVVAGEPALPSRHEADFLYPILRVCIESLQTGVHKPFAIAGMYVVGKDDAVGAIIADTLHDTMLTLVGRDKSIEVGRPYDILQPLVLLDGFAAVLAVII